MNATEGAKTATPLSEQAIAAELESRIRSSVYGPGVRLPSERALAIEFGVSRRYIRMAFSLLIEQGLMEKTHYRRAFVALPGSLRRTEHPPGKARDAAPAAISTIAAILPSHPSFPGGLSLVAGIHKVLGYANSPYRLTFIDIFNRSRDEVLRIEANAIRSLGQSDISGLIWWSYSSDSQIAEVMDTYPNLPVVFIDRHPEAMHCDFAGIDDVESSRMAVEYLFDLNHRRVAHLMDPGDYSTIRERAEGYRQAHTARDVSYADELVVHLDWSENRMRSAFERLYALKQPPTALFTSNDFIAYEFINYAEAQGLKIPQDLSVVGHGNIDRYSAREFLTSVDQPFENVGKAAAKLLLKRLPTTGGRPQSYQQIILPAPLIVRSSCQSLE
jgi:DNA-binding LacI/PurR family transcriptional regulator